MAYLNIAVGLGGTGMEVMGCLWKLIIRHQVKDNHLEWFVLDTADPTNRPEFKNLPANQKRRLIQLETFSDSKVVINDLIEAYPESNISKIFPENSYLRKNSFSNKQGAWEIRQIGYLSLLYHLHRNNDNIFSKINKVVQDMPRSELKGVRVYVISSLAGGTGSGMFIPFCGFLKQSIPDVNIEVFSILVTPEAIAQGKRTPQDNDSIVNFGANAYQALKEIDFVAGNSRKSWEVKLNDSYYFSYNDNQKVMDHVLLIHKVNAQGAELSTGQGVPTDERYLPYFQMISWMIYYLASLNSESMERFNTHLERGLNPFFGLGIQVYEYPEKDVVGNISDVFISQIRSNIESIRNIEDEDIFKDVNNVQMGHTNWLDQNLKNQLNSDFRRQLSEHIGSKNIAVLRNAEFIPSVPEEKIDEKLKSFPDIINKSINGCLSRSYTLGDILVFIENFKTKVKSDKDRIATLNTSLIEHIKQTKSEIGQLKKVAKVKNLLLGAYVTEVIKQYECSKTIEFCDRILSELQTKDNLFRSIIELIRNWNIENKTEYFKFSPPTLTSKSEDVIENIRVNIIQQNRLTPIQSNHEAMFRFISDLWSAFTTSGLNTDLIDNVSSFGKDPHSLETWKRSDEYRELGIEIKVAFCEFLEKNRTKYLPGLIEQNNLLNTVNKLTSDPVHAFPYFPNRSSFVMNSTPYIACSSKMKDLVTVNNLAVFSNAFKHDIISSDNVVIYLSIVGDISLSQINTEEYQKWYDIRKKNKPDFYQYLDAQFE